MNRHMHLHRDEKLFEADTESECEPGSHHETNDETAKCGTGVKVSAISDKPYKCEICGISYRLGRYLINHMRMHKKSYNKRSNLIRPMGKIFKCEKCGICFFKECELVLHRRTHTECATDVKDLTFRNNSTSNIKTDEEIAIKEEPIDYDSGKHMRIEKEDFTPKEEICIKEEPVDFDSAEHMRIAKEDFTVKEPVAVFIKSEKEDIAIKEPAAVFIKSEEEDIAIKEPAAVYIKTEEEDIAIKKPAAVYIKTEEEEDTSNHRQVVKTNTRKGIWLLEKIPSGEFLGSQLPSKEQVLLVYLYHRKNKQETLNAAAKFTSIKLQEVWKKANIPVMAEKNIRADIQKLYEEYRNLGKEKSINTEIANMKRQLWKGDLEELFYIGQQRMMEMKSGSRQDKAFLSLQWDDIMSSPMSGVDQVYARILDHGNKKTVKFVAQKRKHDMST